MSEPFMIAFLALLVKEEVMTLEQAQSAFATFVKHLGESVPDSIEEMLEVFRR